MRVKKQTKPDKKASSKSNTDTKDDNADIPPNVEIKSESTEIDDETVNDDKDSNENHTSIIDKNVNKEPPQHIKSEFIYI